MSKDSYPLMAAKRLAEIKAGIASHRPSDICTNWLTELVAEVEAMWAHDHEHFGGVIRHSHDGRVNEVTG